MSDAPKPRNTVRGAVIAAVVVGVIVVLYSILYIAAGVLLLHDVPAMSVFLFVLGAVPIPVLIGLCIALTQRIKELKKGGEQDAASQY